MPVLLSASNRFDWSRQKCKNSLIHVIYSVTLLNKLMATQSLPCLINLVFLKVLNDYVLNVKRHVRTFTIITILILKVHSLNVAAASVR